MLTLDSIEELFNRSKTEKIFFFPARLCNFPCGWDPFWYFHTLFAFMCVLSCVQGKFKFDLFVRFICFFNTPSTVCRIYLQWRSFQTWYLLLQTYGDGRYLKRRQRRLIRLMRGGFYQDDSCMTSFLIPLDPLLWGLLTVMKEPFWIHYFPIFQKYSFYAIFFWQTFPSLNWRYSISDFVHLP